MRRPVPLTVLALVLAALLLACGALAGSTPGTPVGTPTVVAPTPAEPAPADPTPVDPTVAAPSATPTPSPTRVRRPTPTRSARPSGLPSRTDWLADVATVMAGSSTALDKQIARAGKGKRLALVLDIDNTSIATHYSYPKPVAKVLALARHAVSRKVTVYFVTGRYQSKLGSIRPVLTRAGYRYAGICGRKAGESLATGKQRCRKRIAADGFTVVASAGNRATDFVGSGYGLAFRLPNYGNRLS